MLSSSSQLQNLKEQLRNVQILHANLWPSCRSCRRVYWLLAPGCMLKERCFHVTSRRPCLCSQLILWELDSFLMLTFPFVLVEKHTHWSREWKHSMWSFEETKWVVAISFICSIKQLPLENTLSWRSREYLGSLNNLMPSQKQQQTGQNNSQLTQLGEIEEQRIVTMLNWTIHTCRVQTCEIMNTKSRLASS